MAIWILRFVFLAVSIGVGAALMSAPDFSNAPGLVLPVVILGAVTWACSHPLGFDAYRGREGLYGGVEHPFVGLDCYLLRLYLGAHSDEGRFSIHYSLCRVLQRGQRCSATGARHERRH